MFVFIGSPFQFHLHRLTGPNAEERLLHSLHLHNNEIVLDLLKSVSILKNTSIKIADDLIVHGVANIEIPSTVLIITRLPFMYKNFTGIWAELGGRTLRTTEYQSQANRPAKQFNKTVLSKLQYYATKH